MMALIRGIDALNRVLGRAVAWCALAMLLLQAAAVIARYVFSYGLIAFQDAVVYGHAMLFLLGAALLLQGNDHIRVDVIYDRLAPGTRRAIDVVALIGFVLPVACVIAWVGLPYVARAWASLEGARQPGGLPAVFLLKTCILVFAVSVGLQALAILLRLISGAPPEAWRKASARSAAGRRLTRGGD